MEQKKENIQVNIDFLKKMSDTFVELNSYTGFYCLLSQNKREINRIQELLKKSQECMDEIWERINSE